MTTERNNSEMKQSENATTATTTEPKTEEKRDKVDWIDRDFYTEHGGEG